MRSGRIGHGREARFYLSTVGLLPWRQLEAAAERLRRLIDQESRLHRRDFEQYSAGLAKIDRLEVQAIQDVRHFVAAAEQIVPELQLFLGAADGQRDVMNGSKPVYARGIVRPMDNLDQLPRGSAVHRE